MLKITRPLVVLALLLCAHASVRAQENPPPVTQESLPPFAAVLYPSAEKYLSWDTFGSEGDQFHARLPEAPSVFSTRRKVKGRSKPEGVRVYSAYRDGAVYVVVVYDRSRAEETLDSFVRDFKKRFLPGWDLAFRNLLTVDLTDGEEYSLRKGDAAGTAGFFVKKRHAYVALAVGAAGEDQKMNDMSVMSFTMWSLPLEQMQPRRPQDPAPGEDPEVVQSNQSNAALTGERVSPDRTEDPEQYLLPGVRTIAASGPESADTPAGGASESADEGRVFGEEEVERRALVVLRPEPDYSEAARLYHIEGRVRLKGVLRPSGRVEEISVLEGLPHGLTEKAVQAFRHLRFLPARVNGRTVSQWFTAEYTFALD